MSFICIPGPYNSRKARRARAATGCKILGLLLNVGYSLLFWKILDETHKKF